MVLQVLTASENGLNPRPGRAQRTGSEEVSGQLSGALAGVIGAPPIQLRSQDPGLDAMDGSWCAESDEVGQLAECLHGCHHPTT